MPETETPESSSRRTVLSGLSLAAMLTSAGAAYGTLAAFMGRFLYPARPARRDWMFVIEADHLPSGQAVVFETPAGATINIARQGTGQTEGDFIALSSVCPHLGCQVRWEGHHDRFFCPCHNGVFDPSGKAIDGPPAEANQNLSRYPLKVQHGLLFIELPVQIAYTDGRRAEGRLVTMEPVSGPGHDPCLSCRTGSGRAERASA